MRGIAPIVRQVKALGPMMAGNNRVLDGNLLGGGV
jgi:hypothetical protein